METSRFLKNLSSAENISLFLKIVSSLKSNNVDIKMLWGETLEPGPSLELNVICLG